MWLGALGEERFTLKIANEGFRPHLAWEAERLVLCESPRLPRVIEFGELSCALTTPEGTVAAGSPYLLLSYSPGWDAGSVPKGIDREGLGRTMALQVAEALADLHAADVAHGDVKPANVIVRVTGDQIECKLIDLGLSDAATTPHANAGTLRYLPPEVRRVDVESDARARDLWALGLTLLETLVPEARQASDPLRYVGGCPRGLRHIVTALMSELPAARPAADWVCRQLSAPGAHDAERARAQVRRSYLAARGRQLHRIARGYRAKVEVAGLPGKWLRQTCVLLEGVSRARGVKALSTVETFAPLNAAEQRQWLLRLIGTSFIDFPPLPDRSDEAWVERLCALSERQRPESLTHAALVEEQTSVAYEPIRAEDLILRLGAEAPGEAVIQAAERLVFSGGASEFVTLTLGRILKRRSASARALAVLAACKSPAARVEEAAVRLRLGDALTAELLLDAALEGPTLDDEARGTALAIRSRIALGLGDFELANTHLSNAPETSRVLEARASVALTRGDLSSVERLLERALALASNADDVARVHALFANWAQQSGDSLRAFEGFRQAAEHAARAGAHLEEATYLVGVASTGTNLGRLGDALRAAERSSLLFESLSKPEDAARAVLSRASALAAAGALAEAEQAAEQTLRLARRAKDRRCQAYAHLVLCDVLPAERAKEHLQRARALLAAPRPDDELVVSAHELRLGLREETSELDLASHSAPLDARTSWWSARAKALLQRPDTGRPEPIIAELTALAGCSGAVAAIGAACAYGAELAARIGDGESVRRLTQRAAESLRVLRAGLPQAFHLGLAQQDWVKSLTPPRATDVNLEQLADLETLIRGLSERGSLKALLDRTLDALVLWTSVERGLLLLTAPQGKLVPRAARNLERSDLRGDQLKLSMTLAERALQTRECVVAVDATGELPEVHASVHSLKLRSVLAVPLLASGEVLGVAYLDDRNRRGAFGRQELAWVKLVSTLAAVAISDAKAQLLLRRAARKARRAEERVTHALARREAQLAVAQRELARSRDRGTRFEYDGIVGQSAAIREMLQLVDRVTQSDIPVLVLGESGSGKELIARAIHANGPRRDAAFVSENCSAIPEPLLESTLFGYVKGAFTGAARHHAGLFEVAHEGSLFLDEIADMSLGMQAKLLRALESGEVRRVGANRSQQVDVRVIGATHKNLEELVEQGRFREDLYYRLNVITVRVPPLRERLEDIPLLVRHFLNKHGRGAPVDVSIDALSQLCAYAWPGNIRQLENEIRRALVLADGEIGVAQLSPAIRLGETDRDPESGLNLRRHLDGLERRLVAKALAQTNGNQTRAAQLLGVSRFGLQKMMRRLEIDIASALADARASE